MLEVKEQLREAMQMSYDICKREKANGVIIPDEDMKTLVRYEQLKLIKLTLPKVKLTEKLYYPTIQAACFKGITQDTWVKVMLWATKQFGIKCSITLASVASYRSSPHRYNFIEPVIITATEAGKIQKDLEAHYLSELKKEIS